MAGHSHSANIAIRKNAQDKARGKLFTKLMKEIYVAVKIGGPDMDSNPRLRAAIVKARSNSVPKDNIQRAIKKGSGDTDGRTFEELAMEGYGPGGVAIMARCLTDNRNRTASEVRYAFSKGGGNLGAMGCVGYLFKKLGVIEVVSDDEEAVMMAAMDAGAEDFEEQEGGFRVFSEPQDFTGVVEALEAAGLELSSSEIKMVPDTFVRLSAEDRRGLERLLALLEDCDDVQQVDHNAEAI
jgi:YebC/PmpR family DNA-binding regulatory protein